MHCSYNDEIVKQIFLYHGYFEADRILAASKPPAPPKKKWEIMSKEERDASNEITWAANKVTSDRTSLFKEAMLKHDFDKKHQ